MIVYENSKINFIEDVLHNKLADIILKKFKDIGLSGGSSREIMSWNNSMQFMKNIIDTKELSDDVHVAIEYKIPLSSKRIDIMLFGENKNDIKNLVIIELKQWEIANSTDKNDMVQTFVGNVNREVLHPSYQAKMYEHLLNNFNKNITKYKINCFSCSYLHNADKNKNINLVNDVIYSYVNKYPIYFKSDFTKFQQKIIELIKKGKGKQILEYVNTGEIVPSKKLINAISNIIKGNEEYFLIDSQKIIYETILANKNDNNVFIINGNPGTGKSVVAINLFSTLLKQKKNVVYVAPNASFRNVICEKLKNEKTEGIINQLILGSSVFWDSKENIYDWIIVDEAHRLKDQAYMYKGKNQIVDILKASKNVIFFVDENQAIRPNDIGTNSNIIEKAKLFNKNIFYGDDYLLETQFRCSGMDGYINAIDNVLQIKDTANFYLNDSNYEFIICDSPQQMENFLKQKINLGFTNCKILAGYAWKWKTKSLPLEKLCEEKDIIIPEHNYEIAWNYNDPKMLWSIKDYGLTQAGCVHTCQGLEFDYCGVIIGKDLGIDEYNNLYGNYNNYYDSAGKKGLKNNSEKLNKLIKNIYKILLTRAQKGTFVFVEDSELRKYFKKHILI